MSTEPSQALPDHTFDETGLLLAGDALRIVHGMVLEAAGERDAADAEDALSDLASRLRDKAFSGSELPGVVAEWPNPGARPGTGEMTFHVAAGGSEYDTVTARWRTGADGRPAFTYDYDGRDELYEPEAIDES